MLVTRTVLFKHTGEVSSTAHDPQREFVPRLDNHLLKETKLALLSHDDWRQVEVAAYSVGDVTMPDWLTANEWAANCIDYTWMWQIDKRAIELPEKWQRRLSRMEWDAKYACVKLACSAPRSPFRSSLRNQLIAWLEDASEDRRPSPFSRRQWECVTNGHLARESRRLSSHLYHNWHRAAVR